MSKQDRAKIRLESATQLITWMHQRGVWLCERQTDKTVVELTGKEVSELLIEFQNA